MKTQVSQQNTPKASCKYVAKEQKQQRTPGKEDHFLNLYEKYLNTQGRKRSQLMNEEQCPLQQSTSVHYVTQKQDASIHRLSFDNFNTTKNSIKGLQSYLTTMNTSNSIQNQKIGYFNNKNDSSQGRSQTADGVSTEDIDKKSINTKFTCDILSQTKRLTDKLQSKNQINQKIKITPSFASLLKNKNNGKSNQFQVHDLIALASKSRLILDYYQRENKILNQNNQQLIKQLSQAKEQLRFKEEEIQRLRQMLFNFE